MLYYKDDNFYSQAKTCNSTDRQPTSHIAISIYSLSYLNIYNSFRWIHVNTLFLNQYPWIGILYRADLSNCFTSISLNCTLGSLDIGKGLSSPPGFWLGSTVNVCWVLSASKVGWEGWGGGLLRHFSPRVGLTSNLSGFSNLSRFLCWMWSFMIFWALKE